MSRIVWSVLEKAERANHKYIKKVGDKYFYTQEQIDSFKLTKKADGFYYMDETKITNDPEKAEAFEEKVKEHKDVGKAPLKVGQKVQIKSSHMGSLGRGVVGTIKEIGKDFVRVVNEAGNVFRVPASALAFAKSVYTVDEILESLEKGSRHKGFGFGGPKKARRASTPLGSVKVQNGKRYMKTEKGWKVMKSIRLTIPVMMKAGTHKYIKREGTPGHYVYWYKNASGIMVRGPIPSATTPSKEIKMKEDAEEMIYKDALGNPEYNAIISLSGGEYGKPGKGNLVLRSTSDAPEKSWKYESKDVSSIVKEMDQLGWNAKVSEDGYGAPVIKLEHRATKLLVETKNKLHEEKWKNAKEVYIRFGDIPKGGKSKDWASGNQEKGVSVFRGKILPNGEILPLPRTNQELGSLLTMNNRPLYVITGEEVGTGADGEPVLTNAKKIAPKEAAKSLYRIENQKILKSIRLTIPVKPKETEQS